MLNEKRVKHMVKLASYETKYKEDFKIGSYYKKDYVGINTVFTFLWTTFSYAILVLVLALAYMEELVAKASFYGLVLGLMLIVFVYFVVLVSSLIIAHQFYKKKYSRARRNVKVFSEELSKLERLYEQEEV